MDCSQYVPGTICRMHLTRDIEEEDLSHIRVEMTYESGRNQ